MPLSWNEIKDRAIHFSKEWENETSENAEAKSFWDDFFNVFGINRRKVASFEKPVKRLDDSTGYIDLLWKGTILVEHKSRGKDLDKAYKQALDYFPGLKDYELPKYVLVSDFARLEAIFMIEHAPMETDQGKDEYIRFISGFYDSVSLEKPPMNNFHGEHQDKVARNVSLTLKMRGYAFSGVNGHPNPVPYCLALLEWILPIVCYSSTPIAHKRLSMIVAGLLCKNVMDGDQI